jgi:uncharacterized Zn-finger protein
VSDIEQQLDELEEKHLQEIIEKRIEDEMKDEFDANKYRINSVEAQIICKNVEILQTDVKNLIEKINEMTKPNETILDLQSRYYGLNEKIDHRFDELKSMLCSATVKENCTKRFSRDSSIKKFFQDHGKQVVTIIISVVTTSVIIVFIEFVKDILKKMGGTP